MPAPSASPAFTKSSNVAELRESATIAVSARAAELRAGGRSILDFGAGQPDFDTPAFIRHAAAEAVEQGATRYTATAGIAPLRQAIAEQATELAEGGASYGAAQVVVSTGSKQSLFNACFTLFGPGDEVIVPVPGWTSYVEILGLARATMVPAEGPRSADLKFDADLLRSLASSRTRGLILNSPSNPTGAVYSSDELGAILALAAERGWWVLSDEIYRRITYDAPATSALSLIGHGADPERLVLIDGVAKAYAMTGWRIGWAVGPEPLARAMTALQSHTTYNAAAVSQHAALAALTRREEADAAVAAMVGAFHERRDAAVKILSRVPGLSFVHPAGAFYLFMNVAPFAVGEDDAGTAIARRLLEEEDVAVVPGVAFGTPDWIRMSYAAPVEQVEEGARRIARLLRA